MLVVVFVWTLRLAAMANALDEGCTQLTLLVHRFVLRIVPPKNRELGNLCKTLAGFIGIYSTEYKDFTGHPNTFEDLWLAGSGPATDLWWKNRSKRIPRE